MLDVVVDGDHAQCKVGRGSHGRPGRTPAEVPSFKYRHCKPTSAPAEACHPDVPRQYAIGILRQLTAKPQITMHYLARRVAARRFGHELMKNIKRANPGELPRSLTRRTSRRLDYRTRGSFENTVGTRATGYTG